MSIPASSTAPSADTTTAEGLDAEKPGRTTPPAVAALGLTAALGAVLVVLLALFILPSLKSGPHDLPLGVVGADTDVVRTTEALQASAPEAFSVRRLSDVDELDAAIRDREVVGGLVLGSSGIESHVASAGSTAISGTVTATANALAGVENLTVSTVDVVALPADDPTGIGVGGLAFPLVFGGIVPVVAFAALFKTSHAWRLGGIVGFALVGGLVVSAVLQFWFGSTAGVFWPVAGAMALGIAALALPLSGLQQTVGGKGFTAGAMVMMFLGNPLAGIATTSAWLPGGLGTLGQILPPGATGSLVRAVAYFDGAGASVALATLVVWCIAGLALNMHAALRGSDDDAAPDLAAAPAAPVAAPQH